MWTVWGRSGVVLGRMRAVPPYPAPRRSGPRAVFALVLATASGLLACEGNVGSHGTGTGASGGLTGTGGITGTGGVTGTGGITGTGGTDPIPTTPAAFGTCPSNGGEPGVTPLAKLSTFQYRNTVRDLLNASGLSAVATEVAPMLAAIPDDSTVAFRGLDARISSDHVQGYFNVAVAVADAATKTSARLTSLAGSCAGTSPLTQSCLDAFLGVVRQARAPPPARHRRAGRDEETSRWGRRPRRPTPPRRSATWS